MLNAKKSMKNLMPTQKRSNGDSENSIKMSMISMSAKIKSRKYVM